MNAAERSQLQQVLHSRCEAIADNWYQAMTRTGYATLSAAEVRQRLLELTEQAVTLLLNEPFDQRGAWVIGTTLARLHYIQPETLGRTQEVLACQLVENLSAEQVLGLQPRLAALLGGLAAGFFQQARETILTEQEQIRAALVTEVKQAEEELRRERDLAEALEEATAALTATLDFEQVLDSILEQVSRIVPNDATNIMLIEGDQAHIVRWRGYERFGVEKFVSSLVLHIPEMPCLQQMRESGEPLVISDTATYPGWVHMPVMEWLCSYAAAPIVVRSEVIGFLNVDSATPGFFTQAHAEALRAFADHAAAAIENARLYATERQQLHRLEGLAAASQRITADLDLASVLEEIGTQALTTLEADQAAIFLLDWETDKLSCAYSSGLSPEYIDGAERHHRESPGSHILSFSEPIYVLDAQTDAAAEDIREEAVREGFHTLAVLPLTSKGKMMGALAIYRDTIRAFRPEVLALAQSFANQAAVAIENAQLYQQTDEKLQTRVRELAALYALAAMVNHSDLDAVLQLALDSAIRLTGMDSGGIMLLDPSTNELSLRVHRVGSLEFLQAIRHAKTDEGLMPRMLKSVTVVDLSKVTKERRMAIEKEGLQSLVSIPLKAQENPLGVMVIASYSPRTFAPEELDLLTAIGNQVGVAVDKANLQAQELRAAILEERQHMAQQMHDDIAQTLGYLGLQVDGVMGSSSLAQNAKVQDSLEGIRKTIDDAYGRVRRSIMRLQEDVPAHFDLETALPEIISQFEKQTGCKIESSIDESQLPLLPPAVAFQITYIIREALTNVRKHAEADSVQLTLQGLKDSRVEVTIQDNGRGFDLDGDQPLGGGGFGLRFMKERAERIGGSLRIESGPGQGTRVVVKLPSG